MTLTFRKSIIACSLSLIALNASAQSRCIPEQAQGAAQMGGGLLALTKLCGKATDAEVTKSRADSIAAAEKGMPCAAGKVAGWFDSAYKDATLYAKTPAQVAEACKGLEEFTKGMEGMAKALEESTKKMKK